MNILLKNQNVEPFMPHLRQGDRERLPQNVYDKYTLLLSSLFKTECIIVIIHGIFKALFLMLKEAYSAHQIGFSSTIPKTPTVHLNWKEAQLVLEKNQSDLLYNAFLWLVGIGNNCNYSFPLYNYYMLTVGRLFPDLKWSCS